MKFLILAKPRSLAPPLANPIAAYEAAREFLKAGLADGRIDCVYQFADGQRSVTIGNADSAEELWEVLTSYPLYPFLELEVYPLVNVAHIFDKALERMKKAAGG
jgi:muconolactone delta-isomerase